MWCVGARLWHEGQRGATPFKYSDHWSAGRSLGSSSGAYKRPRLFLKLGRHEQGEVWSEPDGFGGGCVGCGGATVVKRNVTRWFYSGYAVPERMFSAMVRCSGIQLGII